MVESLDKKVEGVFEGVRQEEAQSRCVACGGEIAPGEGYKFGGGVYHSEQEFQKYMHWALQEDF